MKNNKSNHQKSLLTLFLELLSCVSKKRRAQFYLLILFSFISSLAEVISLGSVLPFIGIITQPEKVFKYPIVIFFSKKLSITTPAELVLPIIIFFALVAIIVGVLRIFLLWFTIKLTSSIGSDISVDAYTKTLHHSYQQHIERNSSEIISGITQKVNIATNILQSIVIFITSTILFVSIIFTLFFINFSVTIMTLLVFGFSYGLIVISTRKILVKNSQNIVKESTYVIQTLQEGLGAIRDILIDGSQSIYSKQYKKSVLGHQKSTTFNTFVNQFPRFAMEALGMFLISILILILKNQEGGLTMALPLIAMIALGSQRMLPLMNQIYGSWSTFAGGHASMNDVVNYLKIPIVQIDSEIEKINFKKSIELQSIYFKYKDDSPWVINGIDLKIYKGERIGFIGSTGCGKSTLFDIIMGLIQPNEGKFLLDEYEMNLTLRRRWQKTIAHVPQSIYLTDSTIAGNIAFGVEEDKIDKTLIHSVITLAKLDSFVNSTPAGIDTKVGERGVQLSGGQRQRIGIARALYKQSQVLIFDEATSALDEKTEKEVMDTVDGLSRELTVLIIAHRISTLKNCDKIYKIENGKISGVFKYDQISNK